MVPKINIEEYGNKLVTYILKEFNNYNIVLKEERGKIIFNSFRKNLIIFFLTPAPDEELTIEDKVVLENFVNECVENFLKDHPLSSDLNITHIQFGDEDAPLSSVEAYSYRNNDKTFSVDPKWRIIDGLGFYIRLLVEEVNV